MDMPVLYHLTEGHLAVFLLQLLLLLGLARGLGWLFQRIGQPSLVGEILAGVILGPTLLGRVAPELRMVLFPDSALQYALLDAVAWIGLLLLLLSAGLEVDVSVAWRQRGPAVKIAVTDIVLPMIVAFIPAILLPDRYVPEGTSRLLMALFLATVMTISALPVTLKALYDLDLLKSDLGLLTLSALTINDIVGWVLFTLVLGFATHASPNLGHMLLVVVGTLAFAGFCVVLGRRWVGACIEHLQRSRLTDAGVMLTFIFCLGLLCGAITQWMGIHALFGLFLAGIMAGGTPALSERTRGVIEQMVHALFVPVFFASIGLQLDFVKHFDLMLALLFTVVGIGGRYYGAWVGARTTPLSKWDRVTVAIAHTPGGAMEMIVALIALQSGLITMPVFVAVVFSALVSSALLGPWLAWSIRRRGVVDLRRFLRRRAMRLDLADKGGDRWEALRELCLAAARETGLSFEQVHEAAAQRERTAGTALGEGMAAPHARLEALERPLVVFGRSESGLEWNAPDGLPVHLVFLVLTPEGQADTQVQILSALAQGLSKAETRRGLLSADEESAWSILSSLSAPVV